MPAQQKPPAWRRVASKRSRLGYYYQSTADATKRAYGQDALAIERAMQGRPEKKPKPNATVAKLRAEAKATGDAIQAKIADKKQEQSKAEVELQKTKDKLEDHRQRTGLIDAEDLRRRGGKQVEGVPFKLREQLRDYGVEDLSFEGIGMMRYGAHYKKLLESFHDLEDVTGLDVGDMIRRHKLKIRIGVTKKEQDNLAGDNGTLGGYLASGSKYLWGLVKPKNILAINPAAGTLAHELAHFVDQKTAGYSSGGDVADVAVGAGLSILLGNPIPLAIGAATSLLPGPIAKPRYGSQGDGLWDRVKGWFGKNNAIFADFKNLADGAKPFVDRLKQETGTVGNRKFANYLMDKREVFARMFERFVDWKLHQQGRVNRYLAGPKSLDRFSPTDAEVAQYAPAMEKLLSSIKSRKFSEPPLRKFAWVPFQTRNKTTGAKWDSDPKRRLYGDAARKALADENKPTAQPPVDRQAIESQYQAARDRRIAAELEKAGGNRRAVFDGDINSPGRQSDEEKRLLGMMGGQAKPQAMQPVQRSPEGTYLDSAGQPHPASDRIKAMRIPPAWQNVHVDLSPDAKLLATGVDKKGDTKRLYSAAHHGKAATEKFLRLKAMAKALPAIEAKLRETIAGGGPGADEATALLLMRATGFRPGSERDNQTRHKAIGATTLTDKHVKIDGDKLRFAFTGKKGVRINQTITHPELAKLLQPRLAAGRLFKTDDKKLGAYLRSQGFPFKPKDFRTAVATEVALDSIKRLRKPKTPQEYKAFRRQVADRVARKLGNTRAVALKSYIPPEVFLQWEESLGAKQ